MNIPILRKRQTQREAQMESAISGAVEKALAPFVGAAQSNSQNTGVVSGATYIPGQSSPWAQTAGSQIGAVPLPRPVGDFNSPFGPGVPLYPDALDPLGPSGRAMPRRYQYAVAANLNLVDRAVPWSLLSNLAENCDVVARCINLVQDGMTGREWSWGYSPYIIEQIMTTTGESNHARAMTLAQEKYGEELARVKKFFERPDTRSNYSFSQWMTEALYQTLVFDAVVIYPQYTLGGKLYSLNGIDGSTIKILKDNQGFPPEPPAPAFQQILYGFPRGEFQQSDDAVDGEYQSDQLHYYMRRPRPGSVYGFPQVEEVLTTATTYLARQAWMAAEYTHGAMPRTFFEMAPDTNTDAWTPEQWGYYEQILNDRLSGQVQRRQQSFMLRPGMKPVWAPQIQDHYKSDYDAHLILQIGSKFGVPATQLGVQAKAGLSGGKQMEGEEDQTEHFVYQALISFFIDILNDLARHHLDVGPEITATCQDPGGSEEDILQQAQADAAIVGFGGMTLNDYKAAKGDPLYAMPEADEPFIITAAGVQFLKGQLEVQAATNEQTLNPPEPPKVVHVGPDGKPMPTGPDGNPVPPANNGGTDDSSNDGNADSGREPVPSGDGSGKASTSGDSGSSGASVGANSGASVNAAGTSSASDKSDTDAASKELAAFAKFAKSRVARGVWRDFEFAHVGAIRAGELNELGRSGNLTFSKAVTADPPVAAGIAVVARDTGRLLMLQRTLSDDDPASGKWELPGGHLDPNDLTPLSAAVREFKEETGIDPPNTNPVGSWDSNNGVYRGFVIAVDHETDVPINLDPSQRVAMNPDDPDHDCPEIAAWFDPDDIPTNPAVRSEVRSQTDWSQLSIPQAEKSDVEPIDYEKAGEIVARRIRGDIDRLREAYGLLNEVDGLVKGKNAPAPPVINVHVPEQQAPVIHVASPEVHVAPPEVHVHQTHNHEHHIDAPITLTPTFEVHAPPVTVEHTSNHEHHVTVNPEVHMDAPIIKIPKPQVTVNMPEAPQRGRSTVTRNPDGTVSIEHE